MSLPLTLFFISLIGITFMVSRKLALVRNGQLSKIHPLDSYSHPFVPELQKIKHLTFKGTKKLGYVLVFVTLRFFIKSSNFIKNGSISLIKKLKTMLQKKNASEIFEEIEKKEVSKYLKIIGDYRQKIRKMKHMIKEEEGIE